MKRGWETYGTRECSHAESATSKPSLENWPISTSSTAAWSSEEPRDLLLTKRDNERKERRKSTSQRRSREDNAENSGDHLI